MTFIRNVSITFATKVILSLVGLASSIIVARAIGPEGKGLFSLAILAAAVVFNATSLGIGTGSGYFLGGKKIALESLAGNWLTLSLLIGISVMFVSMLLAPSIIPHILPSVPVWFVIATLTTVPFRILSYNFQSLFKANNDFRRFNMLELVKPVTFLVVFLILMVLYPDRKIEMAVVSFLVSYAAVGLFAIGLIARVVKLRIRWAGGLARSAVSFGVQGYLASFLGFLNLRLDLLLVNLFLEPMYVGYYSISVIVAEKIWYIPDILSVVTYPRVAHAEKEEANRYTSIVSRQTILIVLLGCVGILIFGRFLVGFLFSERFLPAVIPLFLLLPGIFSRSLARVISSDLLARGYPRVNLWAGLVALISNVALNIALIPRMGVSGAALATSFSYTLHALITAVGFIRITGVTPRSILVPGTDDLRLMIKSIRRALLWRRDIEA